MKNLTLISLVTAAFLFAGCGEEKADTTSAAVEQSTPVVQEEAAPVATEEVVVAEEVVEEAPVEANVTATDATPAVEANATTETSVETNATEAPAAEANATTKEAAAPVEEAAAEAPGKALFTTCAACHGPDGKTLALGKGAVIAGQPKADLLEKMHAYKAGTRDITGNGMLMKGQMAALSDADMDALADYISSL
ncbi:MAG: c-type cytochrome [Sulfurovaceae bacterium]|jgi:cytochrome c